MLANIAVRGQPSDALSRFKQMQVIGMSEELVSSRVGREARSNAGQMVHDDCIFGFNPGEWIAQPTKKRATGLCELLGIETLQGVEGCHMHRIVEWAFGIVFSTGVLVTRNRPFAAAALAVKVDDLSGPIIFGWTWVGDGGKTLAMRKFRDTHVEAGAKPAGLQEPVEEGGSVHKIAGDPRLTRADKLVREPSSGEMLQFVSALKDGMGAVRLRLALSAGVKTDILCLCQCFLVFGGLTYYWQSCQNRGMVPLDEWFVLDLLYGKKCNVLADFKLIVQTVGVVLTAQGS